MFWLDGNATAHRTSPRNQRRPSQANRYGGALITGLGYANVRTLLNSGNVIFEGPSSKTGDQALRIQNAIAAKLGVSARVSVVTAADLAASFAKIRCRA